MSPDCLKVPCLQNIPPKNRNKETFPEPIFSQVGEEGLVFIWFLFPLDWKGTYYFPYNSIAYKQYWWIQKSREMSQLLSVCWELPGLQRSHCAFLQSNPCLSTVFLIPLQWAGLLHSSSRSSPSCRHFSKWWTYIDLSRATSNATSSIMPFRSLQPLSTPFCSL